jgi:hypothetical protein
MRHQTCKILAVPPALPKEDWPLGHWTIAELLRWRYPEVRLRQRFLADPYLEQITLAETLRSPFALNDFLSNCHKLPQCGDTSIKLLRSVIEDASRLVETRDHLTSHRR